MGAQAAEASRAAMEQELVRVRAATGSRARVGIDTRNLGRPSTFNGQDSTWRDWSIVFSSYSALVNPELRQLMEASAASVAPALNESMLGEDEVKASTELYHLLLHSCTHTALDKVVNAGSCEGLRAWQLLVERFDPRIRSRSAGQLLALLQFDFSGDAMSKMETFKRAVLTYETSSGERVPESLRIGMVMNRISDNELATHLLLNSERLKTWAAFRKEVVDVAQARAAAAGSYGTKPGAAQKHGHGGAMPMEIDALQHPGKKCDNCGRMGHLKRVCRQSGGGASWQGAGSSGGPGGYGSGSSGGGKDGRKGKDGGKGK